MKFFDRKARQQRKAHDEAVALESNRQTAYRLAREMQQMANDLVNKAAELTREIESDRRGRAEKPSSEGNTAL